MSGYIAHVRHLGLLLAPFVLAGCLATECPCGSDPSDPLSEHDLTYPGNHLVEDECVCRCGDDDPIAFPRDRECAEYERACVNAAGEPAERVCG